MNKQCLRSLFPVFLCLHLVGTAKASTELLEQALEPFKQIQVLRGQFEQSKKLPLFNNTIKSQGIFLSVKHQGLIWTTETPTYSKLIMTPGQAVQTINGRSQVYSATGTGYDGMAVLLPSLLDGDIDQLESYFQLSITGDKMSWVLHLTPVSKELTSIIKEVSVVGGNGLLNTILLTGSSGDHTNIELHSVTTKQEAPDAVDLAPFE